MAIIDQVTLRTGVADWLNRSDLTDSQIDDFVAIGEARIYEDLRVPTLEISQGFSVTATNSSIIVPEGFLEMIELKKDHATDKDEDVVLSRVDSKVFNNNKIKHAYTRHIGNFLLEKIDKPEIQYGKYNIKYYGYGIVLWDYGTARKINEKEHDIGMMKQMFKMYQKQEIYDRCDHNKILEFVNKYTFLSNLMSLILIFSKQSNKIIQ